MGHVPFHKPRAGADQVVEALRQARAEKRLTQKQLAARSGWDQETIRNMEHGRSVVWAVIRDCAQVLDVVILALPGDAWGKGNV